MKFPLRRQSADLWLCQLCHRWFESDDACPSRRNGPQNSRDCGRTCSSSVIPHQPSCSGTNDLQGLFVGAKRFGVGLCIVVVVHCAKYSSLSLRALGGGPSQVYLVGAQSFRSLSCASSTSFIFTTFFYLSDIYPMPSRNSLSYQRSLFCECSYTPCRCWPASLTTEPVASTSSPTRPCILLGSKPLSPSIPLVQESAQELPTPCALSDIDYNSISLLRQHGYIRPAEYVVGTSLTSSNTLSIQSPNPNPLQLHSLLRAQSILHTPETLVGLRVRWDVRDQPTSAAVLSGSEPQMLFEHPVSVAYATFPPTPFILVTCNHALPWLVPIYAQEGSAGVTIRDVFQAIRDVLYTPIEESLLWMLPSGDNRNRIYNAYKERIARVGDDRRGILAVDWLGEKTLFVCLARDDGLARRRVEGKEMWPLVYALILKKGTPVSDI